MRKLGPLFGGMVLAPIVSSASYHAQAQATAAGSFSRPLCAWPQLAHYKGRGDTTHTENFACR